MGHEETELWTRMLPTP